MASIEVAARTATSPPPPPPTRRRRFAGRVSAPYVLLLPAVAVLGLGLGYPVYWQIISSFKEYGLAQQFGQPAPWVGVENYVRIFTSDALWAVVVRSLAFCLFNAGVTVLVGVALALLMRAVGTAARLTLQISMLLAWAMPMVAAVTVFKWLFDWRTGVVNWLLVRMGLPEFYEHHWLAEPLSFFLVASLVIIWMSVPFVALSVYAGLMQVPDEVREAARIDGASATQQFRFITVPMIRPVLAIVLLLQIIWDLRVFAQIRLLQDGGAPVGDTNLLGNFIFELGIGRQDFAGAAAVSIFVLALTALISWPYVRALIKELDR